jgi:uncharacterized membrane protein
MEKPIHPLVARTRYYCQNLHIFHLFLLFIAPLLTIWKTTQIEFQAQTFCIGLGFHVLCGLGITAGRWLSISDLRKATENLQDIIDYGAIDHTKLANHFDTFLLSVAADQCKGP